MSLDTLGQISAIVAAAVALIGLPMVLLQLRVARQQQLDAIRLSGSQVLLAVDAVLAEYKEINEYLRPEGIWHRSTVHPTTEELPLVEPYLGVFERLWIAYTVGQIDIATIKHLYEYRIRNIWVNPRLVEDKLQHQENKAGWSMLIALTFALEQGTPFEGHTDNWQPPEWVAWRARSS